MQRTSDVDDYDEHVAHLVKLARDPGFLDHARHRAKELESLWPGITEAVRAEINKGREPEVVKQRKATK